MPSIFSHGSLRLLGPPAPYDENIDLLKKEIGLLGNDADSIIQEKVQVAVALLDGPSGVANLLITDQRWEWIVPAHKVVEGSLVPLRPVRSIAKAVLLDGDERSIRIIESPATKLTVSHGGTMVVILEEIEKAAQKLRLELICGASEYAEVPSEIRAVIRATVVHMFFNNAVEIPDSCKFALNKIRNIPIAQ